MSDIDLSKNITDLIIESNNDCKVIVKKRTKSKNIEREKNFTAHSANGFIDNIGTVKGVALIYHK